MFNLNGHVLTSDIVENPFSMTLYLFSVSSDCTYMACFVFCSHEKTPMDEAVTKGKMEVIDAISAAVAQAELDGVTVS